MLEAALLAVVTLVQHEQRVVARYVVALVESVAVRGESLALLALRPRLDQLLHSIPCCQTVPQLCLLRCALA